MYGTTIFVAVFFTFVTITASQQNEERDEEGILHVNDAKGLRPGEGTIMPIQSVNYPESAPAKLHQTWRVETFTGHALRLSCDEIRLPLRTDGTCADYVFNMKDGDESKDYCGGIYGLSILSKTNRLDMYLKTGYWGGGYLNCTIEAKLMGPYGEVTTTTTTTTTTENPFILKSEEVDSSEHGGPKGKKSTTCPCGWANKISARIIGGKVTDVNEFPFTAGLLWRGSSGPHCGGTVITAHHVLTAAHCVIDGGDNSFAVTLGNHDFYSGVENITESINVVKVIIHEKYNRPKSKWFDISLLVLEHGIKFNKYIGPACIPSKKLTLDRQYVKPIGWGMIEPFVFNDSILKKVNVRVIKNSVCANYIPNIVEHQLCTYSKMKGLGRGDSGGPVVWNDPETNRYTVVGIPSYVYLYQTKNTLPDVSTDVSSFISWLKEQIKNTKPEAEACWAID